MGSQPFLRRPLCRTPLRASVLTLAVQKCAWCESLFGPWGQISITQCISSWETAARNAGGCINSHGLLPKPPKGTHTKATSAQAAENHSHEGAFCTGFGLRVASRALIAACTLGSQAPYGNGIIALTWNVRPSRSTRVASVPPYPSTVSRMDRSPKPWLAMLSLLVRSVPSPLTTGSCA